MGATDETNGDSWDGWGLREPFKAGGSMFLQGDAGGDSSHFLLVEFTGVKNHRKLLNHSYMKGRGGIAAEETSAGLTLFENVVKPAAQ